MGQWLTLKEAAERLGMTKEGVRKRIKEKQIDAYQDDRGRWMVQLPEPQEAQELEVVAQLPAIPEPDTHELVQRLASIGEVLERQQETIERLTALVEAQGQQAAEQDREREEAAEERAERLELALADVRRAMEAREQAASKKPRWQFWKGR